MTNAPPPKRRNAPKTKAKILTAAQSAFADQGYAQTGIRDIAAMADISSPMLLRYFGSKAGLFEAALIESMQTDELFSGNRKDFGAKLAGLFNDDDLEIKQPSMVVLSTGNNEAREIASRVTREKVLVPLAQWLGPPRASARALQIIMLAMGFVLFTRQLPLMDRDQRTDQELESWFAETVQAIVDATEETK